LAIYYLGVKSFGRSAGTGGSVSTSAAAYRSGERIRDEGTGRVYDHTSRDDIEYKEILLPSDFDRLAAPPEWLRDRSGLWNAVERSEPRPNARVAREYVLALPHELNPAQRTHLARTFAREIADRYHNAVDLVVHRPRTDPRNFHAHLLSTTREVHPSGLGPKTTAELSGSQRFELGLPRAMQEHASIRARWADLTNEALRQAGLDTRVSHVPSEEVLRQPGARPWLPRVAWEIERRGGHSVLGERARQQFELRRDAALEEGARQLPAPAPARTAEQMRQEAIAQWRAIRAESSATQVPAREEAGAERQIQSLRRELGRDDFGL
jgi:MobA/MobL family